MNLLHATADQKTSEIVIGDIWRIPVPLADIAALPEAPIIAGVRPEHLRPATKETEEADKLLVDVTNVEVFGNETVISFKLGAGEWMAKWSGQWHIEIGDSIPLCVDYGALCLFEAETGELIKKPMNIGTSYSVKRYFYEHTSEARISEKTENGRTAILYLLPSILLFSVFVFYPMFRTIY